MVSCEVRPVIVTSLPDTGPKSALYDAEVSCAHSIIVIAIACPHQPYLYNGNWSFCQRYGTCVCKIFRSFREPIVRSGQQARNGISKETAGISCLGEIINLQRSRFEGQGDRCLLQCIWLRWSTLPVDVPNQLTCKRGCNSGRESRIRQRADTPEHSSQSVSTAVHRGSGVGLAYCATRSIETVGA